MPMVSFIFAGAPTRLLETPVGDVILSAGRGEVRAVAAQPGSMSDGWMAVVKSEVERFLRTEEGKRFWHLCLEAKAMAEVKNAQERHGDAQGKAHQAKEALRLAEEKAAALAANRPGKTPGPTEEA